MKISSYTIFKSFFKIGMVLLGGGYVILPLLQSELSEKHNWLSENELCEYFALSQSVPGIIAVNMACFTGYKLNKSKGAVCAISGVVLPAFITIILLASVLQKIVHFSIVQGIFWGIEIGVVMLLYLSVKGMWSKSVNDKLSLVIFLVTFLLTSCFKFSPIAIIIIMLLCGIYLKRKFPEMVEKDNIERNCEK